MNAFDIIDALLLLEQSGKGLDDFFETNELKRVAVYGLGRVGQRVIPAIQKAGVEVLAAIDKESDSIITSDIEVISPKDITAIKDKIDLIIVAVADHYTEIRTSLSKSIDTDIISVEEIINYCLDGETKLGLSVERKPKEKMLKNESLIDCKCRSQKILVFGGSSGIGKAIALRMLNEGSDVVIAGRTQTKLLAVQKEYLENAVIWEGKETKRGRLEIICADVTEISNHISIFKKAYDLIGGLDAFVNSAAVSSDQLGRGFEPWDISEREWDELSNTDFKAAFFLMRNEVNYFLDRNISGNILNISSNAAYMDISGVYGASKLAISKWTRSFAKKYGHCGIVINAIAPGATFTPMIASYADNSQMLFPRHAINRLIQPDEIAEVASLCLNSKGVSLCGSTLIVDGGDNATF